MVGDAVMLVFVDAEGWWWWWLSTLRMYIKKEKMKMKTIYLHGWVVVVNSSEAMRACRTCRSTCMALQTTRIQLEIPTEKHRYRPETARLTYWEH